MILKRFAKKKKKTTQLACTFCNRTQDQVGKLIAGSKALICDGCVRTFDGIMQQWKAEGTTTMDTSREVEDCGFCGKNNRNATLLERPAGSICEECVETSLGIINNGRET